MLKQLTKTVYALKVPENVTYGHYRRRDGNETTLFYEIGFPNNLKIIDIGFKFEFINLSSQATEEQTKGVVDEIAGRYLNYLDDGHDLLDTSLESLQSLLAFKGCIDGEYLIIRKL